MKSRPYLLEVQAGGNGADSAGVMAFFGLLGYVAFMVIILVPSVRQINWIGEKGKGAPMVVVPTNSNGGMPTQYTSNYSGVSPHEAFVTATLAPTPTLVPTATSSPVPSPTVLAHMVVTVGYSYYWPPFGPPNCDNANWDGTTCKDISASGLPWSAFVGRGMTIPYQWKEAVPLRSWVHVSGPPEVAGDWFVMDYCGDCLRSDRPLPNVDFLQSKQALPWNVPILIEIYPGILPPQ